MALELVVVAVITVQVYSGGGGGNVSRSCGRCEDSGGGSGSHSRSVYSGSRSHPIITRVHSVKLMPSLCYTGLNQIVLRWCSLIFFSVYKC